MKKRMPDSSIHFRFIFTVTILSASVLAFGSIMSSHSVNQTFFNSIGFVQLLLGEETAINCIVLFSQVQYLLAPFQTLFGCQPTPGTEVP